jgi:hypothetical protein
VAGGWLKWIKIGEKERRVLSGFLEKINKNKKHKNCYSSGLNNVVLNR